MILPVFQVYHASSFQAQTYNLVPALHRRLSPRGSGLHRGTCHRRCAQGRLLAQLDTDSIAKKGFLPMESSNNNTQMVLSWFESRLVGFRSYLEVSGAVLFVRRGFLSGGDFPTGGGVRNV